MIVTCAWCQNEGKPATLGERAPLDNPAETHGICRRHTLARHGLDGEGRVRTGRIIGRVGLGRRLGRRGGRGRRLVRF